MTSYIGGAPRAGFWRRFSALLVFLTLGACSTVETPSEPSQQSPRPLLDHEIRERIRLLLPEGLKGAQAWAEDIRFSLTQLSVPQKLDTWCAVVAVIEQESGFQVDPPVPGLPKIVEREIETRRQRYNVPRWIVDAALSQPSPDGRSYQKRIQALKTEHELSRLFDDISAELPLGKTLLEGKNPVSTAGPMQVSVHFAETWIQENGLPWDLQGRVRDALFTRRGGIFFGTANLLGWPNPYPEPLFRFADYNAGRYSSRNAAFQSAVALISQKRIDQDGDLLLWNGKVPREQASQTQNALTLVAAQLNLSPRDIRKDLEQEKTADFSQSPTWKKVFASADAINGRRLPRQQVPTIQLKSAKIQRTLTTAWFAERVEARWRTCWQKGNEKFGSG